MFLERVNARRTANSLLGRAHSVNRKGSRSPLQQVYIALDSEATLRTRTMPEITVCQGCQRRFEVEFINGHWTNIGTEGRKMVCPECRRVRSPLNNLPDAPEPPAWTVERVGRFGEKTVLRNPQGFGLPFPQRIGRMAYRVAESLNAGTPVELPSRLVCDELDRFREELVHFIPDGTVLA